jgi:HSP20 family protein
MPIVRWDPFRNVSALQERINRLFDDTFPAGSEMDEEINQSSWRPAVDIYETDEGLVITAELAGVKKEDVAVEVKDNVLTLKGERYVDGDIKEEAYLRRERFFGSFHRAFTLKAAVDPDKIKAKFKDGVLNVEIPKPEEDKPKHITVNVE